MTPADEARAILETGAQVVRADVVRGLLARVAELESAVSVLESNREGPALLAELRGLLLEESEKTAADAWAGHAWAIGKLNAADRRYDEAIEWGAALIARVQDNVIGAALERSWLPDAGDDWLDALNHLVRRDDARLAAAKLNGLLVGANAELRKDRDGARAALVSAEYDAAQAAAQRDALRAEVERWKASAELHAGKTPGHCRHHERLVRRLLRYRDEVRDLRALVGDALYGSSANIGWRDRAHALLDARAKPGTPAPKPATPPAETGNPDDDDGETDP